MKLTNIKTLLTLIELILFVIIIANTSWLVGIGVFILSLLNYINGLLEGYEEDNDNETPEEND